METYLADNLCGIDFQPHANIYSIAMSFSIKIMKHFVSAHSKDGYITVE